MKLKMVPGMGNVKGYSDVYRLMNAKGNVTEGDFKMRSCRFMLRIMVVKVFRL